MAIVLKSAKLDIYIWRGSQEGKGTPKYTLTKTKLSSETTITFEIAELVKDYIDIVFTGDYSEIEQTSWVQTELTRTFEDDTDQSTVDDATPLTRKYIAFRGYGELYDVNSKTLTNTNPDLLTEPLISNRNIYHLKGEPLYVPFYRGEEGVFKVEYKKDNSVVVTNKYGGNVLKITTDSTSIRTDNITTYDTSTTAIRSDGSGGFTSKDVVVDVINEIVFTRKDGTTGTIVVKEIEECKYLPYKVSFMNKFGAIQDLWFFKRSDKGMSVEREEYRKSTLNHLSTGTNFNTYDTPSRLLSSTAKKNITMNTGFVTEDHNEVIKQLLNTEYCWIHESNDSGIIKPTPVKPTSLDFNEKLEVNEKLINFTLQFEYTHNFIQDIR